MGGIRNEVKPCLTVHYQLQVVFDDLPHCKVTHVSLFGHFPHAAVGVAPDLLSEDLDGFGSPLGDRSATPRMVNSLANLLKPFDSAPNNFLGYLVPYNECPDLGVIMATFVELNNGVA